MSNLIKDKQVPEVRNVCVGCKKGISRYTKEVRDISGNYWCGKCWDDHCDEIERLDKQYAYRRGK